MVNRARGVGWMGGCVALTLIACTDDPAPMPSKPMPTSSGGTAAPSGGTAAVSGRGAAPAAGSVSAAAGSTGRPVTTVPGVAGMTTSAAGTPALPMAGRAPTMPPVGPVAGTPAATGGMAAPPPPAGPPGTWPAADPGKMGPFATVTENMVGPNNSYTMFRPKDLTQRHPVITWGNGTGTTPNVYRGLLTLYASHGFIVIASNSMNVAQGTPPPMLDGVTWVLAQDMTMGSPLFGKVDRDRIGATGHSQGAFAASSAGADPRIKAVAPIQSLGGRTFHGPVLGLCGTMDTVVP